MKKTLTGLLVLITIAMFTIAGCSKNGDDNEQPITATLKIMTQGSLAAGTKIAGINMNVVLPSGVSVKATQSSANTAVWVTDAGVVVVSGDAVNTNTQALATYTPATRTVDVQVADPEGFATGEFVTINCDIAVGSFPKASDFSATLVKVVDTNGATISGLTAGFTASINK